MQLISNGPLSSPERTKHIKAELFITKDKIDGWGVELEYCPSEVMRINTHTKPKQGTPFRLNRSLLMNILVEYADEYRRKKTNPLLLPTAEEPQFISYIDLCIEAGYSGIKNLIHWESVLQDSTNCPLIPASKAIIRATLSGASLISERTPDRPKPFTWADLARGNQLDNPTQYIKAPSGQARPSANMTASNAKSLGWQGEPAQPTV